MNVIFRSIVYASAILCLNACEHKRVGIDSFVVTKDGNGNIQSEINYINDTIMHGLVKYYYSPSPKNVLKDEINFNNGKKDGWHKHYRKDGTLESKIHWKKGLQDGETFWYFTDGKKIESESFWVNNKQYGDAKLFYLNDQLERYYSLDYFDNTLYIIKWDSLGNKIKEEGVVFSPKFVIVYTSDSLQTPLINNEIISGKEVAIKITSAQPPQTKTFIRMGEVNNMIELPIKYFTAIYKKTFTKPGKYTLVTVGQIKDMQGNVVKQDSILTDITVLE
jgi:hypothetical protein